MAATAVAMFPYPVNKRGLVLGLLFALYLSPNDYQQGLSVRIMYVHVPSAWLALLTFFPEPPIFNDHASISLVSTNRDPCQTNSYVR